MSDFSKEEIILFNSTVNGFNDALSFTDRLNVWKESYVSWERSKDVIRRPVPYIVPSFEGTDMTGNPFLYMSVALWIVSIQVMLMGLMMEIITRTYHESQGRKPYAVRTVHTGRAEPGGREGAGGSAGGRAAHEAPRGEPE